jgi:rhodanese-related sulfurtransferase
VTDSVGPARLDQRRDSGEVFVLDIRPKEEYAEGHIPESHNAPVYHELQDGQTEALDEHLDRIPMDREIITVCRAGIVARTATQYCEAEGYDSRTLTGGYVGWRQYENDTLLYRVLAWVKRRLS